VKQATIEL